MRYYTSIQFSAPRTDPSRHYDHLDGSQWRLPALVFVDTVRKPSLREALEWFREYFGEDAPTDVFLRSATFPSEEGRAWYLTWTPLLPPMSRASRLYYVIDLGTSQETAVTYNYPLARAGCTELTAAICPCSLSNRPKTNTSGDTRVWTPYWLAGALSPCEQRFIPHQTPLWGPASVEELQTRLLERQAAFAQIVGSRYQIPELPHTMPVRGAPFVPPRVVSAQPFGSRYPALITADLPENLNQIQQDSSAYREQAAKRSSLRRRVADQWCPSCVFECASHLRDTCVGPKRHEDAARYLESLGWEDPADRILADGAFTREQVDKLRWHAGAEVRLRTSGRHSARYVLGQFEASHYAYRDAPAVYRCYRASGDLHEYKSFHTFEEFREAITESDFDERFANMGPPTPLPAWLSKAYAAAAARNFVYVSGYGKHTARLRYCDLRHGSLGYVLEPVYAYVSYEAPCGAKTIPMYEDTTAAEYLRWHEKLATSIKTATPQTLIPAKSLRKKRPPQWRTLLEQQALDGE